MNDRLGVLGYGQMAQSMVRPWLGSGRLQPEQVVACVRDRDRAAALRQRDRMVVGVDLRPVLMADHLLLACKPQQLQTVLEARAALDPPAQEGQGLVMSILAGVSLERLQTAFPQRPCVRAMPNIACRIGAGLTGLAMAANVSPEQRQLATALFTALGQVEQVSEAQMDAFLALAASGPALVAVIMEALADGGVAAGLPRAQANSMAQVMVAGSVALLRKEQLAPSALKDAVCSPGGTSIAAVAELERGGFRAALMDAILAAQRRSRELGR
ncbi:pyrroline-5-carboxylate reductase [Candidatus Synechococcus spongiarum]|uniref:Pyrroline-5-carboxylate reductase n=1 Tax=Candidatus Synechococcus spongiarum LMB bulk15N TaxID=1943583 RepID=A0A1T1D2N1_9SYNE|nr:pyrroline-5-carboxylate reductase [Candidatus Synechococcus spongiarum]OOV35050.1 pyrroline-5-carboxylate reductase [Candidatus Synechococcus spongiarum LMB bulk15N]